MTEPSQALPPEDFSDLVELKAASRRQDAADIAAGTRTPEEVQRDNSQWLIGDPARTVILNEYEACELL